MARHERVALLVEWVGGLARAAEIAEVSPATINNWRKDGATLPMEPMLRLCRTAAVSLDWVATGHMVRPDIASEPSQAPAGMPPANLIRLIDVRVEAALQRRGGRA